MSEPLAIGIVCYPSFGGSGVVASELAVGLAQRGHSIHLIASSPPRRWLAGAPGVTFHAVVAPDYPLFEQAPYDLALAGVIAEVSREHRLDLVQSHYAVPHSTSAYLARQMLGRSAPRFVTTLHGTDVTRVGIDPAYAAVTQFTVAASDGITVPSEFLRREAYRLLGLPASTSIEVIANFVDTDRFAPATPRRREVLASLLPDSEDGPILFHVSNFRPVKRITDLLEVLAIVRRQCPARLVLVGDGPDRPAAEERARQLGLGAQVRFLGNDANFAEYLRHADAFLLPSESESFGVAALEALSAGVPVLGYRVGGLPEVVNERVGRLVEPFDIDALAGAVLEVVGDSGSLREDLGEAARDRAVTHFRREPALARYEEYFRRVIAARPA